MTTKHFVISAIAAALLSVAGKAQSPSDLLQKGIHAQEAAGDLDVAIAIFRQVVNSSSSNKALAAQAQYQLILCMLQKGDREAASKELAALERNFGDMPDLVAKARKLIPAKSALLPEPWGESECEQLDIKRDGVGTGEYLYYSADTWTRTKDENALDLERRAANSPYLQALVLRWELKTKKSTRSITATVDRDTLRPIDHPSPFFGDPIRYDSDDDLGDATAAPFLGPATDVEETVLLLRRLPLAVGYKTTLPVTSNQVFPTRMELTVTGIETVQTPAGKFNCYKVSFAGIGQTFWIGVEGARPLVKFQSAGVEAELVKVWGPENPLESLAALAQVAGVKLQNQAMDPGGSVHANLVLNGWSNFYVKLHKVHTPPVNIAQALQSALTETTNTHTEYKVRPGSVQTRLAGGKQALSCLLDTEKQNTRYSVWIATENSLVEVGLETARSDIGALRFRFDPLIDAIRVP